MQVDNGFGGASGRIHGAAVIIRPGPHGVQVLLQRFGQGKGKNQKGQWGFPGGHMAQPQDAESNYMRGIIRVVSEQCGDGQPNGVPNFSPVALSPNPTSTWYHVLRIANPEPAWQQWQPKPRQHSIKDVFMESSKGYKDAIVLAGHSYESLYGHVWVDWLALAAEVHLNPNANNKPGVTQLHFSLRSWVQKQAKVTLNDFIVSPEQIQGVIAAAPPGAIQQNGGGGFNNNNNNNNNNRNGNNMFGGGKGKGRTGNQPRGQVKCRSGAGCKNNKCGFFHGNCHQGANCQRKHYCKFQHPVGHIYHKPDQIGGSNLNGGAGSPGSPGGILPPPQDPADVSKRFLAAYYERYNQDVSSPQFQELASFFTESATFQVGDSPPGAIAGIVEFKKSVPMLRPNESMLQGSVTPDNGLQIKVGGTHQAVQGPGNFEQEFLLVQSSPGNWLISGSIVRPI
eukprot:TRINITY_DN1081_c0_g1_i2.p1 TRINITY_DN1081_c0_g1~~TRINITY_DN1081_c0_g1_i2.p1  ORF type:complete len:452 (-),score=73.31 TRINITY_DN1081_c0_g1_i2:193-1548(-)